MEKQAPPKTFLHYTLFILLVFLSAVRALIWTTPNNKLHALGLELATDLDFMFGFGAALVIAIISFLNRKSKPSKLIYYVTQVLSWGQSVGLFVLVVCTGLYAAFNGLI